MLKHTIPFIDLRGRPWIDMVRAYPDKAESLLRASKRSYGFASQVAAVLFLGMADRKSKRFLSRTKNPFQHEIESYAELIGKPGILTLNLAYEWGCTSGAYASGETVDLLRVLDWPFPDLGKHIVVALCSGKVGDYYQVTWPALAGVYQGMAPGRFAAAINQAPMRKHGLGYVGDWVKNRRLVARENGLPPAHLLRLVFENAANYQDAKEMLCKIPLAMPVIFTISGTMPGEGCIIERLENAAEIKELSAAQCVTTSNEFHSGFSSFGKGWRPREIDSAGRFKQSVGLTTHEMKPGHFDWLRPPMLNQHTRLVMRANAATGMLMTQGFDGTLAVTETYKTI